MLSYGGAHGNVLLVDDLHCCGGGHRVGHHHQARLRDRDGEQPAGRRSRHDLGRRPAGSRQVGDLGSLIPSELRDTHTLGWWSDV